MCFNNKLSFLKSMTTLIAPFFLGIANDGEDHPEEYDGELEAHSEE
jgi:hypothetical protein